MYALEKNDLVPLAGSKNKHSSRSGVSRELQCFCLTSCFLIVLKYSSILSDGQRGVFTVP